MQGAGVALRLRDHARQLPPRQGAPGLVVDQRPYLRMVGECCASRASPRALPLGGTADCRHLKNLTSTFKRPCLRLNIMLHGP